MDIFRLLSVLSLIVVLCPSLSCMSAENTAPGGYDTPKRIDGRIEPTITQNVPTWANEAERLALIEKAQKSRIELLQKYPPPIYLAKRVPDGAVKVDGKLDDEAWKSAAVISGFRGTRDGVACEPDTQAKILWDSKAVYFAFNCPDSDILAAIDVPDGEFWREDCVEIFVNGNGDEISYIEFETGPKALIYDASVADYRPEIMWAPDAKMAHLDIDKSIRIFKMQNSTVKTQVDGTPNKSDDVDKGWTCEIAMDWGDIARGSNVVRTPPKDGDVWRIGLYRGNINKDQQKSPDTYGAWNPTTTWYHGPWTFGRVVFVE